ncbi:MAG: Sensor protein kinase WalK [Alphaproteobacteria bacterium MarineAlpha5_Bin9]|nr:MAG: Sensor protein kinase WalK [Alphaproteobacteria bacterium MarineAlpha5_Bin9]|tara:strand:- start:3195 stop:5333 length:2139 start_codon:yes stop_codon:yes gene_type:complete
MNNFKKFLNLIHINQSSFYVLIALIIISFSITFYLLLPNNELVKDPQNLLILLSIDVILVILLFGLLTRQIILILIFRKRNYQESRLHIKFVNLFTLIALGPAIGVVIITSLFFNLELRTWYGKAVKEAIINSNIVARSYSNEIQEELISDIQLISREIIKVARNNEVNKDLMDKELQDYLNLRTISNIYVFNLDKKVLSSFNDKELKNFIYPSNNIFNILDKSQIYIYQPEENSITAYQKLFFFDDTYLQINRKFNNNIWKHIEDTSRAFEIYTSKEEESKGIQITFSMIFVLFSICFILIAILIGLRLAGRLSKPMSKLIESANRISTGNLNSFVDEDQQFKEINVLIRSYNQMINEIKNNQDVILAKSEEDEKKRLFIEAILSLLTTGVISLDQNFKINLINKSSLRILKKDEEDLISTDIINVFPELKKIFEDFKSSNLNISQHQLEYIIDDNIRNLNIKIIKEKENNQISGYVVTIDDMTSLILAEKHAAWSDIARKIAHEVKNPLTPIKLSSERIQTKFIDKNLNKDDLIKLTNTISRQVDDIGKLIDEFSSFARMPNPEMKLENLNLTIQECFDFFSNSYNEIKFALEEDKHTINFQFDKFQISQALNNLIKNSIEAVVNIPNPSIKIIFNKVGQKVIIKIIDNGIGVKSENIRKLFEPYYTTKEKGTGLGLSIVKKILEDHNGSIKIEKNTKLSGSTVTVTFKI